CHLADYHQFFRTDLPSGNSWHDGISPTFLDIGQKSIVCILNCVMLEHKFIPYAGQNRSHQGLADLKSVIRTYFVQQPVKSLDLLHFYKIQKFLAGVGKMLTNDILELLAHRLKLEFEQIVDHGDTSPASRTSFGTGFYLRKLGQPIPFHGLTDVPLGDILTGTDLCF